MNDDWGILGLEGPTDDLATVKRAYAARLRIHRPDSDPDGFQRLREAYERVLETLRPRERSAALDAGLGLPRANPAPAKETFPGPQAPTVRPHSPPGEAGSRFEVHLDLGSDSTRNLSTGWKTLWQDFERRRRKDAWSEFLSGDAWHDMRTRRRLELEILTDLQDAWLERDLRWIHEEAWLLLERNFGWLDRELSLASVFLDDFVDFLAEEIRRCGRRFDPANFPPPPTPRFREIEDLDDDVPKRSRTFWIALSVILAILGSSVFKAGWRAWRRIDARVAEREEFFQELHEPVPVAPVVHAQIAPAVPERPVVRIREWSDEGGGKLPNTCAGGSIPDEPCPWTDGVQVLRAGREADAKLILTVGETAVETLEVQFGPTQRLRLCTRKGNDVVAIEEGVDPCSSKIAKAWTVRDLHLRAVGPTTVVCDTSQACRWKKMGL